MRRTVHGLLLVALVLGVVLAGCARQAPRTGDSPRALILASDPIGTTTYIVNAGLGTVIQRYTGIKTIVQPVASSPVAFNEMKAGRVDIITESQSNDYLVFRALEEYKDIGPIPLRMLGGGNKTAFFWVTRPDTGIKSVKDFVGKRVAYISGVSPPVTEMYRLALEYNGIVDKVVGVPRASMQAAAQMLIEKKADVIGGPFGSFAYELKEATGFVAIPLGEGEVKYLAQKRPDLAVVMVNWEAGYFALPERMSSAGRAREITVTSRMSDDMAYSLTKAVYDHPEDTKAIHVDVGEFNLNNSLAYSFLIPVHPGAVKYYKEKGLWTREHEALQQKYLDEELSAKKK